MPDRELTRLFLRRFVENDLISPEADRHAMLSQTCAAIITGGLFVTVMLSLGYLSTPFPLPDRTSVHVLRVQFLYSAWSMLVMALVAVSVWDALSLDSRDTMILGPLPLAPGTIVRAKISALIIFASIFAAALNLLPALVHPVLAVSRLRPGLSAVAGLISAHLVSTIAASAFGFAVVLGIRELIHAALGPAAFRRFSLVLQAGFVVALVTALLLVPGFSFRIVDQWLADAIDPTFVAPFWFVGIYDMIGGYSWDQLPRPELPARMLLSENAYAALYHSRRPLLHQLGISGGGVFLAVMLCSAAAYLWNNRRLPDPPSPRADARRRGGRVAQRLIARQPIVQAGFVFTLRVLARSVQNRFSIALALAVAVAVSTASLQFAGMDSSLNFSIAPNTLFAIQLLFVGALAGAFRHSVRVPAELRARWLFHLVRPANHAAYLEGAKRAALVKLVLPILFGLLPLHVVVFGLKTAVLHFAYGLLIALVLFEALLLQYRRLPFASSYVPAADLNTRGPIYLLVFLAGVWTLASIERFALSSTQGTLALFGTTGIFLAIVRGVDAWQRREAGDIELDEIVELPTQRLGLMDEGLYISPAPKEADSTLQHRDTESQSFAFGFRFSFFLFRFSFKERSL